MNVVNFVIHSMLRTAYLHIETVGWGHVSDSIGSLGFIHFVLFTTLLYVQCLLNMEHICLYNISLSFYKYHIDISKEIL